MPHPAIIKSSFPELAKFVTSCHAVVRGIVSSLNKSLNLPPGLLESMHELNNQSCDQARLTHAKPSNQGLTTSLGEHTDFGSVTVLFNQLGGLQALAPNKKDWEFVLPRPDLAVINLGDSLIQLVGSKLYSAVHRVCAPPKPQNEMERYSVVYFSRPNSSVKLRSLFEYPTDSAVEMAERETGRQFLSADAWVERRAKNWNVKQYQDEDSYKLSRGTEHNRDA